MVVSDLPEKLGDGFRSTLVIEGIPFDTATHEELNHARHVLHQAISVLGEMFCLYGTTVRRKLDIELNGEFHEPFTKQVNDRYHDQFSNTHLYRNSWYLTILYKGIDSGKMGKALKWWQRFQQKTVKQARETYREQSMVELNKAVQQLRTSLGRFKPRLLGERDDALGYSELLRFHGLAINGLTPMRYQWPQYAIPTMKGYQGANAALSRYPQGNLANYLPTQRLFFGSHIEFRQSLGQSRFGAMLSVKEYGPQTGAIMLNSLMQLDCEWMSTNSFTREPNEIAQQKIVRQLIRLQNANDPASSQQDDLAICRDDLASGLLTVGYHHHTLMVVADDLETLQKRVNQAIKCYSDIAFVAVQETIGIEPAFWAQLAGNQPYIVRSSLITSQNFVDFFPLHNYRTGYRDGNHLGEAVTLIQTPSRTPMFFNYHTKGSGNRNDLTPGHTTIIGGNGSGKTVFMGLMDAQMSRYGGRTFVFDRDRGMEIYVRATGGAYARFSPSVNETVTLNPFQPEDTPSNRSFLKQWLAQLLKQEEEIELPAEVDAQLAWCVEYAYDSLVPSERYLSTVTQMLPVDFQRRDRLNKWLQGDSCRPAGEYAYLFDHPEDTLSLKANKMGFDMTDLMRGPNTVMTAVCMYLMPRIRESLDGQRVSLYFDEGWQMFDHPYWKKQLKEDLPTFRKMNAHIVLATQSPETVVNSALSAQFLDNVPTNIFFCNNKANFEKHYRHFQITSSEFSMIKETPAEQRLFLYKQNQGSAICRLNLRGMDEEMAVFSGNSATVKLLDDVREKVGNNPKDWLPLFHQKRRELEASTL